MSMLSYVFVLQVVCVVVLVSGQKIWMSTDELENHINPDDLREFLNMHFENSTTTSNSVSYVDAEDKTNKTVPNIVDCFGLWSYAEWFVSSVLNMEPDSSTRINTHFYFSSRKQPKRVKVYPGEQFGLEWVDFNPNRKTVMIVHGFMSESNDSWVHNMTTGFLQWADLNVIAVDWSAGAKTFKYWRAVANTRRVASDVANFLRQLKMATNVRFKDFHFVGHSLGAHISSFVSNLLGGVSRITGLDPAQPCFSSTNNTERLDASDADFVDIIHTNGRIINKIGFGIPDPVGHADFYPNGGMKQPGCHSKSIPYSPFRISQAVCSHGRAHAYFTESLLSKASNCTFRAHRWNLTYEGVNASLVAACDRLVSCAEMGINAVGNKGFKRASGPYFVLTTEKEPYCPTEWERHHPSPDLLRDLLEGFTFGLTTTSTVTPGYADPMGDVSRTLPTTTPKQSFFYKIFCRKSKN